MAVRSVDGLEGRVIVEQCKGGGRDAQAASAPQQRHGILYLVFMRLVFGSRRMWL